jgi:hypothetical protein
MRSGLLEQCEVHIRRMPRRDRAWLRLGQRPGALCVSAVNPTRRPQAGSYKPTGANDVGARLRATQRMVPAYRTQAPRLPQATFDSPQRRRERRERREEAASTMAPLHTLRLRSKIQRVARHRAPTNPPVVTTEEPPCGRPPGGWQRTARTRRTSPQRPSIHPPHAENAEKRRHPPWPLCTLCVSAVKSNASPASGLLQANGCGRRRSPLAGDPAGGASVPHASAAPPPSDLRFTAETQRTQRRGGTHHDPSAHSASPQ